MFRVRRMRLSLTRGQILRGTVPAARARVRRVCVRVESSAIVRCPVDTGYLRSQHGMSVAPTAARGQVYNTAEYAGAVHDGSRRHTVVAAPGKVLRFVAGGEVVYARRATIPARKGNPWLARAGRAVAVAEGASWSAR